MPFKEDILSYISIWEENNPGYTVNYEYVVRGDQSRFSIGDVSQLIANRRLYAKRKSPDLLYKILDEIRDEFYKTPTIDWQDPFYIASHIWHIENPKAKTLYLSKDIDNMCWVICYGGGKRKLESVSVPFEEKLSVNDLIDMFDVMKARYDTAS